MADATLTCQDEQRRAAVRQAPQLCGLDYVEVSKDQCTLTVYFLGKAPTPLPRKENVRIDGGRRIPNVAVKRVDPPATATRLDDFMTVTVASPGDFSTYTLRVVALDADDQPTDRPMDGFDPRYAQVEFSFKANCPGDLDCQSQPACPPPKRTEPEINYLAKDYSSFRQLILDRLALIMPDWQERHLPDLGIALVEILAYAGDSLSYYQDAVATEAYLATARQRISIRRHARLVDYAIHEGCNARAWVWVETDQDFPASGDPLAASDLFCVTTYDGAPALGTIVTLEDLEGVPLKSYEAFEPLIGDGDTIRFFAAHNQIDFYTWDDQECCLPRGATAATLVDPQRPSDKPTATGTVVASDGRESVPLQRSLQLKAGDFLFFEEVRGAKTGDAADADPTHRQVVRLTKVEHVTDPLNAQTVIEIEWAPEDALTFPLCLSAVGPAPDCALLTGISVARGNVMLVDHGRRVESEPLGLVPSQSVAGVCDQCGQPDTQVGAGKFEPILQHTPLTFSQPLPRDAPAGGLVQQDPRQALPWIKLNGTVVTTTGKVPTPWTPQPDLLESGSQDADFTVEVDNDGRAHLRFGDGDLGKKPDAGTVFSATYRIGDGLAGNVGRDTIAYVVSRRESISGVGLIPHNPFPAQGGTSAETLAQVKLLAPGAFRRQLERAITADDYATLAAQNSKVQRAAAVLRWTGSWYEAAVGIDPLDAEEADAALLNVLRGDLYRYRRMGHDLVVTSAAYVPLAVEMRICVQPHYQRAHVEAALLDVFSNRTLADGRRGFFHPDNLSFGDSIYLSRLVGAAQAVAGVASVTVTVLQRLFAPPNHELENGVLPIEALEIAQLDNDPSFPEHGKLVLDMQGGR